jgi:hypothetical protein
MSREQAIAVLWESVLSAWDEGDFDLAREFETHMTEIDGMTDREFLTMFEATPA